MTLPFLPTHATESPVSVPTLCWAPQTVSIHVTASRALPSDPSHHTVRMQTVLAQDPAAFHRKKWVTLLVDCSKSRVTTTDDPVCPTPTLDTRTTLHRPSTWTASV